MAATNDTPRVSPFASMKMFVPSTRVWRPMKIGFEGWAKCGKTVTMFKVAIGVWIREGRKKDVVFLDTENAAPFVRPYTEPAGLVEGKNFFVTRTRSLTDFQSIIKTCVEADAILLIDSTIHLYENMTAVYLDGSGRSKLLPQDSMVLKPKWKELFTDPYVNATCHAMFTGRAAWEYSMEENEETHKKDFYKSGVKMRGDNETAYEADLLVLMERMQETGDQREVLPYRRATIIGSRWNGLDGMTFENPGFDEFKPYYEFCCEGTLKQTQQVEGSMVEQMRVGADRLWVRNRERAEQLVGEIEAIFNQWGMGGSGALEKAVRTILYKTIFDNRTTIALAKMEPFELDAGKLEIEHLAQHLAHNKDALEKMFKEGQVESLNEFIVECHHNYQETLKKAPSLELGGVDMKDDIPDFAKQGPEIVGSALSLQEGTNREVHGGKLPEPGSLATKLQQSIEQAAEKSNADKTDKTPDQPTRSVLDDRTGADQKGLFSADEKPTRINRRTAEKAGK